MVQGFPWHRSNLAPWKYFIYQNYFARYGGFCQHEEIKKEHHARLIKM